MSTVELEVPIEDVPERWREGCTLREGDVLVVTVKEKSTQTYGFWDVARNVAGVWADRTDEEIGGWQDEMRTGRDRRFRAL